jgi:hypothetical protein
LPILLPQWAQTTSALRFVLLTMMQRITGFLHSAQRNETICHPRRVFVSAAFSREMIAGKKVRPKMPNLKAILPCPDSHRQKRDAGVAHGKLQKFSTLAHD